MAEAGIRDLRDHLRLSRYLERVQAGEELTVTDRGRPIARLIPVDGPAHVRLARCRGSRRTRRDPEPTSADDACCHHRTGQRARRRPASVIADFDTSALIPLLIEEPGSVRAGRVWDVADHVTSVRLIYTEARAALAQRPGWGGWLRSMSPWPPAHSTACTTS
jgi:prevent-host-death family protein